jgi:hypothetical protein
MEGTGGTRTVSFTVNRSGAIAGSASVRYSINGIGTTPTNANDFLPVNEWTIDFEANHPTRVVTIHVNTDADLECNEKFRVALSNPIGGTIGTSSTAVGWIGNDDLSNGKVYPKCFSVPKTLSGRSENDEIGDYYDFYDGAPAEMIAGLGTDGDWEFGDDHRAEDDAPQIGGVIATSDPLWMFVPPTYLAREQPSMPGTKSFDAASYFGGPPHGLKDDRKYEPDHGDDRWRELSFAELDRDRRESSDPHTLIDDALADWVAV